MACYAPRKAYRTTTGLSFYETARNDNIGSIELPCRQCIGCRLDRANEWTLRIMHEAQLHERNCFITLTYSEENRPASLTYSHWQQFMRRLRKQQKKPIRFYMAGEYTPTNYYPHFHACLFGIDFPDAKNWKQNDDGRWVQTSETLEKAWRLGFSTVGELNNTTAGYCARYIIQKRNANDLKYQIVDDDGEITFIQPEFNRMSLKPGIGANWFQLYHADLYNYDYAINKNGLKQRVPVYYDKLRERTKGDLEDIKYERQQRAAQYTADNTDERLKVRHEVHKARIRALKERNL